MKNEIQMSKLHEGKSEVNELDDNTFIKLFINHRPVYGVTRR
jgi:hypothetical protein